MRQTVAYLDTSYQITLEPNEWSIAWQDDNDVPHKMEVVAMTGSPTAELLQVTWQESLFLADGSLARPPQRHRYDELNWLHFYSAVVPYQVGLFVATQCMNGLTRRSPQFGGSKEQQEGVMFFDALGNLVQPVVFELEAGSASEEGVADGHIEVRLHNSQGAVEYKLNQGSFGLTERFDNLPAGTYTVTLRDEADTERSQTITINVAPTDG